jgi:hypothetical protein
MKVPPASSADRTRMVLNFLQESTLPKEGIQKRLMVTMKVTNQAVFRVNHFSKTTNTKEVKHHFQKSFLNMMEEMGDMILAHISITLMIKVAFHLITDTDRAIVVLDLTTGMQYKMWVCKIVVPIEAHLSPEVSPVIEASIIKPVVSAIPTIDSSTNIMDSHRKVDKAKEGVCNFV